MTKEDLKKEIEEERIRLWLDMSDLRTEALTALINSAIDRAWEEGKEDTIKIVKNVRNWEGDSKEAEDFRHGWNSCLNTILEDLEETNK